eukprot:m.31202 g.31202  ORF g.31202 m.31202 type:complete len:666 (-) comp9294_c0_seq2:637-2634(-)
MVQQLTVLTDEIEQLRKQHINTLKDHATLFKKSTDNYYSLEDKTFGYSSEKDEAFLTQADAALDSERKAFQKDTIQYVHSLKTHSKRARITFVDQLTRYTRALSVYHETASSTLAARLSPLLARLTQATSSQAEACVIADEEESRYLSEYFCPKPRDPLVESTNTKQGYLLYRNPQPSFFKNWQRHYMVYTRSDRTLRGTLFKPDERVDVDRCTQMLTGSTERRFCFEVLSGDKTYLFQARSDDERRSWMSAMGAMQPMKTIRKKKSGAAAFQDFSVGRGITSQKVSLLQKTMLLIELHHLEVEGIYRVSGQHTRIQKLLGDILERNREVDLREEDPAVLAGAVKQVLRDLPEPIFPFHLYDPLVQIAQLPDKPSQIAALREILQSGELPVVNFELLKLLFKHLCLVASKAAVNKMTPMNLGLVIGPTLLRCKESLAIVNDIRACTNIVELGIVFFKEVFDDLPLPTPSPATRAPVHTLFPTSPTGPAPPLPLGGPPAGAPPPVPAPAPGPGATEAIYTPLLPAGIYELPATVPAAAPSTDTRPPLPPPIHIASAFAAAASAAAASTSANTLQPPATPGTPFDARANPPSHRPPVPPRIRTPRRPRQWRALFECVGADETELTFKKDDIIEDVEECADEGWKSGRVVRTGQVGLFPANYCQESET